MVNCPCFSWLPFSPRRESPAMHPECVDAGRAVGWLGAIPGVLSPTETLCGPLVVTVLQAAWCGHVCHIPPCHPTRRRAVSWLSSCHTWMMLLRLGVWQWLALVTITIRTSFLILLVQKVCVLEIGRRLIFPLSLLSCCAIYFTAPFMFLSSLLLLWRVNYSVLLTSWYLCACTHCCTDGRQIHSLFAGPLATVSHLYSPGELQRKKSTL